MKFNIRKISAIGASLLMAGMTAGIAAAANYPAPFVSGGTADVAIVYGTGSGVSSLDQVQAGNIQTDLSGFVTGTSTGSVTEGGDSVKLERSSDKFNLGDSATTVFVSSIDEDDLPDLLAQGTYTDDQNTEFDFDQKVELGSSLTLSHFSDSDYEDSAPTIGFQLADDTQVLKYTLDFTTHPNFNDTYLETTTMKIMGKDYYILDVINSTTVASRKMTLLDSANAAIVSEGTSITIAGKSVSIEYISSSEVKLNVDSETTNSLAEGGTYKLSDGTYVGIKDIMYDAKDAGISKVEISIGTGKLELTQDASIELNDETIEEIKPYFVIDSSLKLDKLVLNWTTNDEVFLTADEDLLMPGFEAIKLSMGAFVFPKSELTKVSGGSDTLQLDTTIKSGAVSIDLLGVNSTGAITAIGKDTTHRLITSADTNLYFNETGYAEYIVASWNSSTEAESYYLKVDIETKDSVNQTKFTDVASGEYKYAKDGDAVSFGNVEITVVSTTLKNGNGQGKVANLTLTSSSAGDVWFNKLYTAEGLTIHLPFINEANQTGLRGEIVYNDSTATNAYCQWVKSNGIFNGTFNTALTGHGWLDYYQWFTEEDKDENIAAGNDFNITVTESGTSNKIHVSAVDTAGTSAEIGDTDTYVEYANSDLATKLVHDQNGDYYDVEITYAGDQAYADVYVTAPETVVSGTGVTTLGDVLVKDTEVSSVATKNLIVVGGSCINSAAAALVGGAYCGSSWEGATGVGSGQFLIKGYASSSITSKVALLVAGYEAADTVNAATYLTTKTVDTSKTYKGTSSTSAELVVS